MIEDITELWNKEALPRKGNIKFLNYVVTSNGERYDSSNAILDYNVDDDIQVGTWFRNNYWGNCCFQAAIVYPQGKRSADLRIFGKCPLISSDNTVEIKTIKSKRQDGLIKRMREAQGQSENVIIDVTEYPFGEDVIKKELIRYLNKHNWLRTIAVKKDRKLLFVWKIK